MVMFQFDGVIIVTAILTGAERFAHQDEGYNRALYFNVS